MTIDQILKDKGPDGRSVTTVEATASLREAARILDDRRIGAVVALKLDGSPAGVLSERDIVRQVARRGASALDIAVADAMTREVVTTQPGETVDAALEQMTDRRIRHLPVYSGGQLVGLVSIGDLVKWKIAETEAEAEAMKTYLAS